MSIPAQGAVGAETMTAAIAWLAKRLKAARSDSEAHPEGHSNRTFYEAQAIAYENVLSLLENQKRAAPALASPRADSDERTADDAPWPEQYARLADGYGPVEEWRDWTKQAGRDPLSPGALHALRGMVGEFATPAQPAEAVPDSLRAQVIATISRVMCECGPGLATGVGCFEKTADAVLSLLASHPAGQSATAEPDPTLTYWIESETERLCNFYPDAAASIVEFREELVGLMEGDPAGQSAGSGASEYQHPGWKTYQQHGVLRTPDSTRTGQVGVPDIVRSAVANAAAADGFANGPAAKHYAALRALEWVETLLAARPAAPEAKGAEHEGFTAGYAMACANIVNLHGEDTIAEDVLAESGITLAEVKALGLTEYDMKPLRALFREIARKRKISKAKAAPPASSGQGGR